MRLNLTTLERRRTAVQHLRTRLGGFPLSLDTETGETIPGFSTFSMRSAKFGLKGLQEVLSFGL